MSKSTPISNLPNLKKQGEPAFQQRENEIVKEILNEIDSSGKGSDVAAQQDTAQAMVQEQARQQQIQQQMMEQQMMEQQMMEQQMMEQQPANELQAPVAPNLESVIATKPKSLVENVLANLKPSLIVAVIVALLSVPAISNALVKVLSSKESLKKLAIPLTLVIKGLMGGALFYAANTAIPM
tara:strand:- start:405 stop:950 length:546 start_codon:yes stop_codon:yes gene_type:complete